MGLDLAEFLIYIEEGFNVELFANDFSNISTLEEFITLLEEETAKSPHTQVEADYLFQEKFLVIQNFFAKELAIDPSHLTPETQVASLLHPLSRRRRIWKKMRKEISPNIPPLDGKFYCECLGGMSVCFAVLILFIFALGAMSEWWGMLLLAIFYGIVVGFACGLVVFGISVGFYRLCFSRLFSTIPKNCDSLQGVTRCIVRKISLDSEGKIWNRETITEAVLRIISEQMGIPREQISLTEDMAKIFG